jgi:type IV pilus assembly protein PilY1
VDLSLPRLTHSVAARVTALDLDGDEFADRLYAADVGARIWRFDIWNGRSRGELITGGIFSSLGAEEPLGEPATAADARRFFNAPDVALMHSRGEAPWLNIAIGSGDGGNAGSADVLDRFYSLRDREAFTKRSQASYDAATPMFDHDLVDITDNPVGTALSDDAAGWKLDLEGKVLSDSLTVNGVVLFTTYEPAAASACESEGSGQVYAVTIDAGAATLDLNRDGVVTEDDLSAALEEGGVPGAPRVEVVRPGAPGSGDPDNPGDPGGVPQPGDPPPPAQSADTRCYAGAELMSACVPLDTVVRTFWMRTLVN